MLRCYCNLTCTCAHPCKHTHTHTHTHVYKPKSIGLSFTSAQKVYIYSFGGPEQAQSLESNNLQIRVKIFGKHVPRKLSRINFSTSADFLAWAEKLQINSIRGDCSCVENNASAHFPQKLPSGLPKISNFCWLAHHFFARSTSRLVDS